MNTNKRNPSKERYAFNRQFIKALLMEDVYLWPLRWQIMCILLCFVIGQVVWFYVGIMPRSNQLMSLTLEVQATKQGVKRQENTSNQLAELKNKVETQKEQHMHAFSIFPHDSQLANLLPSINQIAASHNLDVVLIEWGEKTQGSLFEQLSINVVFLAYYHDIERFIQALVEYPSLLIVENIQVSANEEVRNQLYVQMEIITYQYINTLDSQDQGRTSEKEDRT